MSMSVCGRGATALRTAGRSMSVSSRASGCSQLRNAPRMSSMHNAARHFASQSPMDAFEQVLNKVPSGVKDAFREPIEGLSKSMTGLTDKSVEHISGVVHALILLSRANLISEAELDEKLAKLLPEKAIALVKEQAKLMPADPYMVKFEELSTKIEELSKKVDGFAKPAAKK